MRSQTLKECGADVSTKRDVEMVTSDGLALFACFRMGASLMKFWPQIIASVTGLPQLFALVFLVVGGIALAVLKSTKLDEATHKTIRLIAFYLVGLGFLVGVGATALKIANLYFERQRAATQQRTQPAPAPQAPTQKTSDSPERRPKKSRHATGQLPTPSTPAPAPQVPAYVGGNYCPNGICPSSTTISAPPPPRVTFKQSDEVSGNGRFTDSRFVNIPGLSVLIINLKGDFANPSFLIQCDSACGTRDTKVADRQRAEVYWDVGYTIKRRSGTDFIVKLNDRLYDRDMVLVYIVAMDRQPLTITNVVGL